jgi:hypothetical protein
MGGEVIRSLAAPFILFVFLARLDFVTSAQSVLKKPPDGQLRARNVCEPARAFNLSVGHCYLPSALAA